MRKLIETLPVISIVLGAGYTIYRHSNGEKVSTHIYLIEIIINSVLLILYFRSKKKQ